MASRWGSLESSTNSGKVPTCVLHVLSHTLAGFNDMLSRVRSPKASDAAAAAAAAALPPANWRR